MPSAINALSPRRPNMKYAPTARATTTMVATAGRTQRLRRGRIIGSRPGVGGTMTGVAAAGFAAGAPPGAYGEGAGEPYDDGADPALSINPASSLRNAARATFTSASVG